MLAHIEASKHNEKYKAGEEADDDGETRNYWYIPECPLSADCSKQAFGRANCWSMESEEKAISYLKHHLKTSSKHLVDGKPMSDDAIDNVVADVEVKVGEDTAAERQAYRVATEKAKEEKASRGTKRPRASGSAREETWDDWGGDDHSSSSWQWQSPMQSAVKELQDQVRALSDQVAQSKAMQPARALDDAPRPLGANPPPVLNLGRMVTIPVSRLQLLKETLVRSKECNRSCMAHMLRCLQGLKGETQVIEQLEEQVDDMLQRI